VGQEYLEILENTGLRSGPTYRIGSRADIGPAGARRILFVGRDCAIFWREGRGLFEIYDYLSLARTQPLPREEPPEPGNLFSRRIPPLRLVDTGERSPSAAPI